MGVVLQSFTPAQEENCAQELTQSIKALPGRDIAYSKLMSELAFMATTEDCVKLNSLISMEDTGRIRYHTSSSIVKLRLHFTRHRVGLAGYRAELSNHFIDCYNYRSKSFLDRKHYRQALTEKYCDKCIFVLPVG